MFNLQLCIFFMKSAHFIWVGFYVIRDGYSFFDYDSIYGIPSKIAEVILLALLWNDKP